MTAMTAQCAGKGCVAIIPIRWGDLCSCCFYEGMNPQDLKTGQSGARFVRRNKGVTPDMESLRDSYTSDYASLRD